MSASEAKSGQLPLEQECTRVCWFVRLRWLAGSAVLIGGCLLRWGLGWPLSLGVEAVGLAVLLYNLCFHLLVRRQERLQALAAAPSAAAAPAPAFDRAWSWLARAQVVADLLALTVLLHYTGGLYSPLLPFAVVHIVLASLLLRRREVLLQAGLAIGLVGALAGIERAGLVAAERLGGFFPDGIAAPLAGYLLHFGGFVAFLLVTAVLASTMGSALRKREQQLLQAQAELQQACRRLEQADQAKAAYTQMVTHELRSPAAAILSLLEVVRQGYTGELPERAREMLERCVRRAEVLVELVNQMLDLARNKVELSPERTRPVSVAGLLQQLEEAYLTQAEVKGTLLCIERPAEPLAVCGDPGELGKLFSNLVGNALKYTPKDGEVGLRTWREGERVVVEIRDTGIGIPAEEQGQLFGTFFRASNARKQVTVYGTGLGLAIVKRIVEAHHGSIRFHSEEGKGTTFWVELPGASPATAPAPDAAAGQPCAPA